MAQDLEQTSSYASGALSIMQAIQTYGVDPNDILNEVGLDASQFRVLGNRIDTETFCRYLQLAYDRCGDPCLGLKASDYIHPTSYHALGLALLSSSTLGSYLKRWERYYALVATHGTLSRGGDADGPWLEYQFFGPSEEYPDAARQLAESNLATVIKFIRFMVRPDWQPVRVELMHSRARGQAAVYRKFLGDTIRFDAERNAIYFDPEELDHQLPAANAELARTNDQVIVEFLARMDRANVPAQVHAKLIELLPSGDCSKTKVASALFMSVRTLHNKLAAAGVNYQQLLDQTRRELAEQYMKQMNISISEVAYLLGFSDCSNFSRAFQRWTGSSPSSYRDAIREDAG
jgi:AraC-like DNA-binding protein